MAVAEISIIPVGTGSPSVSRFVAEAVKAVRKEPDVKYELTAMGTILEGDIDRLLAVARKMHQAVLDAGAMRVVTTIKIDHRLDKPSSMAGKVAAVKTKLA